MTVFTLRSLLCSTYSLSIKGARVRCPRMRAARGTLQAAHTPDARAIPNGNSDLTQAKPVDGQLIAYILLMPDHKHTIVNNLEQRNHDGL